MANSVISSHGPPIPNHIIGKDISSGVLLHRCEEEDSFYAFPVSRWFFSFNLSVTYM